MTKRRFEATTKGCNEATAYLKEINEWGNFNRCSFSTDGWSLVDTANYFWNKNNTEHTTFPTLPADIGD